MYFLRQNDGISLTFSKIASYFSFGHDRKSFSHVRQIVILVIFEIVRNILALKSKYNYLFTCVYMALGAGANVRACELETPCSNPVEVALADLFHFEA